MQIRMQRVGLTTLVWAAAALAIAQGAENNRFKGGFYDGWNMDESAAAASLGGPVVTLSSGVDQVFTAQVYRASAATLTITESAGGGGILADNTMILSFPPSLNLQWDITDLALGGTAVANVDDGNIVLSNNDTHLEIPVLVNFDASDTLTLSGLKIVGFPACPQNIAGRLLLDFDGDGLWDAADTHTMTVRMWWSGGLYAGWDRDALDGPTPLFRRGTVLTIR